MNSVNLIGNLTRDPEIRRTESGTSIANMRLAINGKRDGDVTYIDVVAFDKQAEACAKYLTKGRKVAVSGRISYSEWEADDGTKRSKHEVIGRVEFLPIAGASSNGSSQAPSAEPVPVGPGGAADEEIPF